MRGLSENGLLPEVSHILTRYKRCIPFVIVTQKFLLPISTWMLPEVRLPSQKVCFIFYFALTLTFNMAACCVNSSKLWWKHVYFTIQTCKSASKTNLTSRARNSKLYKMKEAFAKWKKQFKTRFVGGIVKDGYLGVAIPTYATYPTWDVKPSSRFRLQK